MTGENHSLRLAHLTTPEVASRLESARWVALLPVGSTEAHGPHLPLNTDVIIAEESALRAATQLRDAGVDAVVLPPIPYAVTEFVRTFPGTVSVRAETIGRLLDEISASLFEQGFALLAFVNGHLEPEHGRMLKDAAVRITSRGRGVAIFPDQRRPPTVGQLGEEFAQGGGHAGGYETSLILAARPELVREEVRLALTANFVDIAQRMKEGARDAVEAGGTRAYFGDPANASIREGERLYGVHAEMIATAVRDHLARIDR